jgi:uncharacterized protein (DUF488 family)
MEAPAHPTIWTIGHGTRPIDDLIGLLTGAGIRRLVDVRTVPGSRRNPQYGRDPLNGALEGAGIDYVWRKELGGLRSPRADSPHTAIRNASFRGYADHMGSETFAEALGWLMETSREVPTAVMCAESLWWRCHRRMVADALTIRGWGVLHLMDGGRVERHRLHPNARVDGDHLVYDVEE